MPGMLGEMPHDELFAMRERAPAQMQGMLAPFEHRAFAREWAEENPMVAGPSLAVAIPAYALAKKLGLMRARTPASLDEIFAGYHGLAEGMLSNLVPPAVAGERPRSAPSIRRVRGDMPQPGPRRTPTPMQGGVRG